MIPILSHRLKLVLGLCHVLIIPSFLSAFYDQILFCSGFFVIVSFGDLFPVVLQRLFCSGFDHAVLRSRLCLQHAVLWNSPLHKIG